MAQSIQLRKGFLRLQRLGPVKFTEQSRWAGRAPEAKGLWAFPYPHFDIFFAYHKYTDLAPKELRSDNPKDPKWYLKDDDSDDSPEAIFFEEVTDSWGYTHKQAFYLDDEGQKKETYVSGKFYEAKDKWVEEVGKKVLPMRNFWYSGDLYSRFTANGAAGASGIGGDWTLMSVQKLAELINKPGGTRYFDGHYDGDGKPQFWNYSKDHLEVFIPRNRGIIRSSV